MRASQNLSQGERSWSTLNYQQQFRGMPNNFVPSADNGSYNQR
jgi:hypothetical protein